MPVADPIRIVDARGLDTSVFDSAKVTARVHEDLVEFQRALKQRGYVTSVNDLPSEEEVAGYVSNIRAWLDNESRRAKEVVVDLTASPANRETILQWIKSLSTKGFNDRDFDLSLTSHSRAAARRQVFEWATANDISHFAMVVPPASEESITEGGTLADHVGRVRSTDEWHDVAKAVNKDRRGLSLVFSLGLHHNDPHQMIPVPSSSLGAAAKVMAEYRSEFFKRLRRRSRRAEA